MSVTKKLAAAALLSSLLCGGSAIVYQASHASAAEPTAFAERHPKIHSALHELRDARKELADAPHDFGGHRAEALKAVDEAIKQLDIVDRFER